MDVCRRRLRVCVDVGGSQAEQFDDVMSVPTYLSEGRSQPILMTIGIISQALTITRGGEEVAIPAAPVPSYPLLLHDVLVWLMMLCRACNGKLRPYTRT